MFFSFNFIFIQVNLVFKKTKLHCFFTVRYSLDDLSGQVHLELFLDIKSLPPYSVKLVCINKTPKRGPCILDFSYFITGRLGLSNYKFLHQYIYVCVCVCLLYPR